LVDGSSSFIKVGIEAFLNLAAEEQVPTLWKAIFKAVRIGEGATNFPLRQS